ncbi:ATP-binding protein [Streptomyces chartreusis]|uniref:ATP-binding protein n=1 Tax=Streptomyces chartreusis TaxID=1969 RepID=UPI003822E487
MTMIATGPTPLLQSAAIEHPAYTQALALTPASVSLARLSVRTTLTCWGQDSLADPAALVVSELVTNSVRHAAPRRLPGDDLAHCRLTVERLTARMVRAAVADSSPRPVVPHRPTDEGEHGSGLAVVAALSAQWDVEMARGWKTVWAEPEAHCGR